MTRPSIARRLVWLLVILPGSTGAAPEPGDLLATARELVGDSVRVASEIPPHGQVDVFCFEAGPGQQLYAATRTTAAGARGDTLLDLLGPRGTSIETDDDDGAGRASSLAGVRPPTAGRHCLLVRPADGAAGLAPYELFFERRRGETGAEREPNDDVPQPLALGPQPPAGGPWVTGTIGPNGDVDRYSLSLTTGQTLFVSLDLDPERRTPWNGRLTLTPPGGGSAVLADSDGGPGPPSEALVFVAQRSGAHLLEVGRSPAERRGGGYRLSATVFPPDETPCPPGSVADPDLGCRPLAADLGLELSAPGGTQIPGLPVTYTLRATNGGPDAATGVQVVDRFPAIATNCVWTCRGIDGGTCTGGSGRVLTETPTLPAGATALYSATCDTDPAAAGILVNRATVAAAILDPDLADNSDSVTLALTPLADAGVLIDDGGELALPGQAIAYLVRLTNAGPSALVGATLATTITLDSSFFSVSTATEGFDLAPQATREIVLPFQLPVGTTGTITTITASATVAAPAGTADPSSANNVSVDTTRVSLEALSARLSVEGHFHPGGAVTYILRLRRLDGSPASLPAQFDDTLPTAVGVTDVTASSGNVVWEPGSPDIVRWNGAIPPPPDELVIRIEALIAAQPSTAPIANQGVVQVDTDGIPGFDISVATDDPATPAPGDATIFTLRDLAVLEIPTLNPLGLLLLAGLVAAWAVARLGRAAARPN